MSHKTLLALAFVLMAFAAPTQAHRSHPRTGECMHEGRPNGHAYQTIVDAFATFDANTSPPTDGQPATLILADWLAYLGDMVVFEAGNDPARVGQAAVADYFAPLLPVIGAVEHDLDTVSPICGLEHAWLVRGTLNLTRRSDGQAIPPIRFADTLFLDDYGTTITRYEIRFDPAPIGLLFVP